MDVLAWHNDARHTGQNLQETILTPANVGGGKFHKLFALPVDGRLYAQPLYKGQLAIAGGVRNVVYAATMHDSVYAFDADVAGAPLWHASLLPAGATSVPVTDYPGYTDIADEIGILSTPAIDAATGTLYVVAKTKDAGASSSHGHVYRLHALDLATGAEKLGGPVVLQASVPGTGDASVGGVVSFDPYLENQRSALLLEGGAVWIAFASYGDTGPYHGWVLSYDATTLARLGAWNSTPDNPSGSPGEGGVWMAGASPASDGASVFLSVGNGWFDATGTPTDWGNSVVRFGSSALAVADSFTPSNQATLSAQDLDLGSGGLLLLPDQPGSKPHLLVTAGKEGTLYVLDRDSLGGYVPAGDAVVQEQSALLAGVLSTPAYWNGLVYVKAGGTSPGSSVSSPLVAYRVVPGSGVVPSQLDLSAPAARSSPAWGWPGSTPSISANGATAGIVWAIEASVAAGGAPGPAVLHAFDATSLGELYASSGGDTLGKAVKFTLPVVANGKVFVGADAFAPTPAAPAEVSVFGFR